MLLEKYISKYYLATIVYGAVHLCATNFVQTPNPPKNLDVTLTLGLALKSSGPARPFGAKKKENFFLYRTVND